MMFCPYCAARLGSFAEACLRGVPATNRRRLITMRVTVGSYTVPPSIMLFNIKLSFTIDLSDVFKGLPTPTPTPTQPSCFNCRDGSACVNISKTCDFHNDCADKSDEDADLCGWPCDFQRGTCSWTNSNRNNFDWTRHKGCTGSINTGPCYDADNRTSGGLKVVS